MDNAIIVLIGVAGTLGGAWLGWFLNRNSTQKAVDLSFEKAETLILKQEFLKVAANFQCAFTKEIRLLKTSVHKDKAQQIVNAGAVKHENARKKTSGWDVWGNQI